jgi:hypothetical protein
VSQSHDANKAHGLVEGFLEKCWKFAPVPSLYNTNLHPNI